MAYQHIITEERGRVGLVTLNRPQALNALCTPLIEELGTALAAFEADAGIGALRLPRRVGRGGNSLQHRGGPSP